MSITYNAKGLAMESFRNYQHLMNGPTSLMSFADGINANYSQFINNPKVNKNGQASGQAFEVVVGDALFKLFEGKMMQEGKLTKDLRIIPCLKLKKRNAEVDYVVHNGKVAHLLFLKTSFRERWKQEDRDALVFTKGNQYSDLNDLLRESITSVECWALGYKERPKMSDAQAVDHMRMVGQKFFGIYANHVMSTLDKQSMEALAANIRRLV